MSAVQPQGRSTPRGDRNREAFTLHRFAYEFGADFICFPHFELPPGVGGISPIVRASNISEFPINHIAQVEEC